MLYTGRTIDGKHRAYNENGKSLISEDYDWIQSNQWGWLICRKAKLRSAYDSDGNAFPALQNVGYIKNTWADSELIGVLKDDLFGFYNRKGELVLEHQYEKVSPFLSGIAKVQKSGNPFFINAKGERVSNEDVNHKDYPLEDELAYLGNDPFRSEEYEPFTENGQMGLRAKTSQDIAIRPEYDGFFDFKKGLIIVKRGNAYGVIDLEGEVIIPLEHEFIYTWEY